MKRIALIASLCLAFCAAALCQEPERLYLKVSPLGKKMAKKTGRAVMAEVQKPAMMIERGDVVAVTGYLETGQYFIDSVTNLMPVSAFDRDVVFKLPSLEINCTGEGANARCAVTVPKMTKVFFRAVVH